MNQDRKFIWDDQSRRYNQRLLDKVNTSQELKNVVNNLQDQILELIEDNEKLAIRITQLEEE